jgi:hypothetical protein
MRMCLSYITILFGKFATVFVMLKNNILPRLLKAVGCIPRNQVVYVVINQIQKIQVFIVIIPHQVVHTIVPDV